MSLQTTETPPQPKRREPIRTPVNLKEAQQLAARLRKALLRSDRIHARKRVQIAKLEQRIAALKKDEKERCAPYETEALTLAMKLKNFIERNRRKLTEDVNRKTVEFPGGEVYKWQAVRYTKVDEERFYKEVREQGLADTFIRTKDEPNRNALLEADNKRLVDRLESVEIVEDDKPVITVPGSPRRIEGERHESGILTFSIVAPEERKKRST